MSELRKDPVIERWVIIATERAKRPTDFVRSSAHEKKSEGVCPFCPGNEGKTPPEVLVYSRTGNLDDPNGWWLRVVPNKYPALKREGDLDRIGEGMYDKMNGIGDHEVVIETPDHFVSMADYKVKQVEEIIWAYRDRMIEMKKDNRFKYIMIFKNHGKEAGASLDHPHSQIISLPIVPKRVKEEIEGADRYFNFKGRCVYCDMVRQELGSQKRLIEENEDFIALSPFASRFPFETWILPKQHAADFHEIQKNEVSNFALILRNSLHRIKKVLNDPPYNFMLHTSPRPDTAERLSHYHWHLEITPKLTLVAGFEWGTGFYINPMPPETAAESLRACAQKENENPSTVIQLPSAM
ncbi:MAG: galactose-1-phosphate uridylyltransferase [Candidatus Omnitrophota bacterium]|jgi:UDPglucose--hexose-1-phosphate uridylyltransferase|nr:MAG: galactose-1-phosphate uridylyltransferase [Candidatus Omnitrophota bacterium]